MGLRESSAYPRSEILDHTQCAYIGLARGRCAPPSNPRRRTALSCRRAGGSAPRHPLPVCADRRARPQSGRTRCFRPTVARSSRWLARSPSCRRYHCSAQRCRRAATPASGARYSALPTIDQPVTEGSLTKAALVEEVAHVAGLTKKRTEVIVETMFRSIAEAAAPRGEGRTPAASAVSVSGAVGRTEAATPGPATGWTCRRSASLRTLTEITLPQYPQN